MLNMHRKSIGKNGSSRQRNANIFFDLIGDNIPQILHSPFNIIPDLAQFFIEEFTSPKIKTDAEVMEGVQKQLEKELEEGTGSVYPTPSPRCPPKVSAFVSAFD